MEIRLTFATGGVSSGAFVCGIPAGCLSRYLLKSLPDAPFGV